MENNKKVKTVNKKKKMSKGGIVLLVGIIVILIPCLIFGGILISAALKTGKPVVGSRFDNDLEPSITNSDTKTIESNIKTLSGVENCTIELKSAQYRVNVDVDDSLSDKEIESLIIDIYNEVNKTLSISTYFTATDSKKMYDLAINVYNFIDEDSDNMIYYLLTKNSKMDTYTVQCVSKAVDEDLAKELRGETSSTDDDVADEESDNKE